MSPIQQPAWGRSREFEITTRSVSRGGITQSTTGDLEEEEEEDDGLVHGRRRRKVAFMPSLGKWLSWWYAGQGLTLLTDTTHTIYYRGHWLRVRKRNFHHVA